MSTMMDEYRPVASDHGAMWEALAWDMDRPVIVVNESGRIVFANGAAAQHVGLPSGLALNGKHMEELVPPEYARERLSVVREVAATGQTIALEGMTRGRWRRSVFRPVGSNGDNQRCVMAVLVPVPRNSNGAVASETGYEVRRAKIDDFGPLATLSEREMEVLRLIAEGKTTAEIAKALHRSVKTVEWHRVALGTKLGVQNRVELARIAIRAGLVNVDDALADARPNPAPVSAGA